MNNHAARTPGAVEAGSSSDLHSNLRQMIAVLEEERQALATLDAATLDSVTRQKDGVCERLALFGAASMDETARELATTAKALNEVNRRVRNLLAANVAKRLDALGSEKHAYTASNLAIT